MVPSPAVCAFRATGIATGSVIANRRNALQTVFARPPRTMFSLDFMMTSIEINSVNKVPGVSAWACFALDIREENDG
jgi:hypothetical protein